MLKENPKIFNYAQKAIDSILVIICLAIAYWFRFDFLPQGDPDTKELFLKSIPILIFFTLYAFYKHKLYHSQRFSSRYSEILTVFKANTLAFLAFIVGLYFISPIRLSRITWLTYFLASSFLFPLSRIILRNILRRLRRKGHNLRHFVLIGSGQQISDYINTIRRYKDSGIKFKGWIDDNGMAEKFDIPTYQGDLESLHKQLNPDAIIIGYPLEQSSKTDQWLKHSHEILTPIKIIPDLRYSFLGFDMEDFAGIPIMNLNQMNFNSLDQLLKRLMDFVLTLIGLIVISPLLLLISLAVKLTSKGPIFYGQERMGLDGKNFKMWKFRSMKTDAEDQTGAVWAIKDDPRRTPIGTFLRSSSLDELPQLWNVLVGDMSLIGPRPERPVFVDKFKKEIPAYMLRHKMKAGITGWAQVNGWRGDTSLEKRIECDIYYIKNWSLWLDIKILFMTFISGFINKNAY